MEIMTAKPLDKKHILLGVTGSIAAYKAAVLVRLLIREDHLGSLGRESLDRRAKFHASLSHLVATGKADGLVRTGPAELWASVWYVVVRHLLDQVATGSWEPTSPSIPLVIDAAWNAIAARGTG